MSDAVNTFFQIFKNFCAILPVSGCRQLCGLISFAMFLMCRLNTNIHILDILVSQ